jgi:hypothetical protein
VAARAVPVAIDIEWRKRDGWGLGELGERGLRGFREFLEEFLFLFF